MRRFIPLVAALALAGCTDADWAHVMSFAPEAPPPVQAAANANYTAFVNGTGSRQSVDQLCARAARDRSDDLAGQGFDEDIQKKAYDRTYGDCLTWSAKTRAE